MAEIGSGGGGGGDPAGGFILLDDAAAGHVNEAQDFALYDKRGGGLIGFQCLFGTAYLVLTFEAHPSMTLFQALGRAAIWQDIPVGTTFAKNEAASSSASYHCYRVEEPS